MNAVYEDLIGKTRLSPRCKRGVRSATQEFTCDNGYCIPLEKRCDQTEDCRLSVKKLSMVQACLVFKILKKKHLFFKINLEPLFFYVKIAFMPYVHNIKHPFFYIPYFSDGSDEKSCEKVDIPSKGIWISKYSQKVEKNKNFLRFL